jgi:hypothetical protein
VRETGPPGPAYPGAAGGRSHREMLAYWLDDLESLEAVAQDAETRRIFLRMSTLTQTGRLAGFLDELQRDGELDDATKGCLTEIARDRTFLLAVEEYLVRTHRAH